jgi:hypothetical protein
MMGLAFAFGLSKLPFDLPMPFSLLSLGLTPIAFALAFKCLLEE